MLARAVLLLAVASSATAVPNLMLFYETLCPHCAAEMRDAAPALLKKFGDDVFISLVPYGNAVTKVGRNGTINVECQHGQDECTANTWHACSHLYMPPRERVDYAVCTMSQGRQQTMSLLKKCTSRSKVALLQSCAEGPMGVALTKLMADITDTAGAVVNNRTRHVDGVPSVFIDGFPVSSADKDKYELTDLICLKAKKKPTKC